MRPATIRAELFGTEIAVAEGIKVESRSPVCELARRLVAEGHDPGSHIECYRRQESTGEHTLALTGRLGWFAGRIFTEGAESVHARPYRLPDAGPGQSQSASGDGSEAFHTGAPASQAPDNPEAPGAALSGGFSDHESAGNYGHVLVRIGDGWRVILCPGPEQFILQRQTGRTWQARAFCTRRDVLIRECRGRVGPMSAEAEAELEALPDRATEIRREGAHHNGGA